MNKIAALVSIAAAITAIVMLAMGNGAQAGIPIILFFVSLSIAIRGNSFLKGLSFTVLIFAAVAAAMFHPTVFTHIGSFDLKALIVPLLMIIMFGMGSSMSFKDFVGVVKMPKGVIIGIICQFTIMPWKWGVWLPWGWLRQFLARL